MCRQKQDRRDCVGGIRDKGSQRAATAFAFVSIKERARSLRLSQRLCLKGNVCRFNYVDFIKGARVLDKLFWLWSHEVTCKIQPDGWARSAGWFAGAALSSACRGGRALDPY